MNLAEKIQKAFEEYIENENRIEYRINRAVSKLFSSILDNLENLDILYNFTEEDNTEIINKLIEKLKEEW